MYGDGKIYLYLKHNVERLSTQNIHPQIRLTKFSRKNKRKIIPKIVFKNYCNQFGKSASTAPVERVGNSAIQTHKTSAEQYSVLQLRL